MCMSYEILYGKSFIKTPKGRIVPLTLHGSNNCTEFVNGREVLERNWGCFVPDSFLYLPQDEFLKACRDKYPDSPDNDYEAFKAGSKWVYRKDLIKWFEHGIKNAGFLEEYRTKSNMPVKLTCYICLYLPDENKYKQGYERIVKTSKELDEWIDCIESEKYKIQTEFGYQSCVVFDIKGERQPLHLQKDIKGPVACCIRPGSYLFKYDENSMTFSPNVNTAIIFDSIEDAKNKLGEERFYRNKFVKAENLKFKPFVIKIEDNDIYFRKRSRKYIYKTSNIQSAYGFLTEKAAQKYIQKLSSSYSKAANYTVVQREKPLDNPANN